MNQNIAATQKASKSKTDPYQHFLNTKGAWDQVFGNAIAAKRNWRNLSFVLSLGLLLAIAGAFWQGSQSKIVPHVIVLDKEGQELYSGAVKTSSKTDPKMIKKELGSFIKKNRLASVDRQLMLQNIDWVYAHMLPNTNALKKMNAHYQENNPFEMIAKETRIVERINSVLPVTKNTWAIEWQEAVRGVSDGEVIGTSKYKAIITISSKNPETPKQWSLNPFGIWIIDIEWEKKI